MKFSYQVASSKQKSNFFAFACLFSVAIGSSSVSAYSAGFEILKPHRAIYDVKLNEATERSGIASMNGRIVYEMEGNECDGMSVRYRFVSRVNANGDIFTTDQQTASYEAPDGNEYSFLTKSFVNERLERTVKGLAEQNDRELIVKLDSPEEREIELPNAKFISAHLVEVIEKARAGVPFFQMDVFDGGDDADQIMKTTNIIGRPNVVSEALPGENKEAISLLSEQQAWPVTIAYFDNKVTNSTEPSPVYEVSFLLYEGGISRRLVMKYPDYSIKGTLVSFELLEREACTMKN